MLRRACCRLALRRGASILGPEPAVQSAGPQVGKKYILDSQDNWPVPEPAAGKYITKPSPRLSMKDEWIEAIGYPGMAGKAQTVNGAICTTGRLDYGPHRYDYGRVKMPKGWVQNFCFGSWEIVHILFVADRWILFRQIRHIVMLAICFSPLYIHMIKNANEQLAYKACHQG